MKRRVIFVILFVQLCTASFAQTLDTGCDSLLFEKVLAKNKVQRLWIYSNGSYILSHYEKNRIGIDTGRITKKGKAVHLISKSHSGIDMHLRPIILYENKLGWAVNKYDFQNRKSDIWLRVADQSQTWRFNPVSNDTICDTTYYKNGKRLVYKRITHEMQAKREQVRKQKIEEERARIQKLEDEKIAIQGYKAAYLDMTNLILPEYAPLLNNYYCGPGCFEEANSSFIYHQGLDTVFSWSQWNSEAQRLAHFDVTIHETAHKSMYEARVKCNSHLNGTNNSTSAKNKYVILNSKREFIECDFEEMPKSSGMTSHIPEAFLPREVEVFLKKVAVVSEKSPRLQTYIFTENISSNVHAIYGMLNEFSAYFHGVNATWLLYKRADTLFSKMQYEELKEVLYGSLAYYEFSLFMAWYIDYLKHEHPETYKSVLRNINMRKVFTDLEFTFNKLIIEIEQEIAQIDIINLFNSANFKGISEGLKAELENSQDILNEFRIRGKHSIASR